MLDLATRTSLSRSRYVILGGALVVVIAAGLYSLNMKIGDANPGSPILWPDSTYNLDSAAINQRFEGVDRMFVVIGDEDNRGFVRTTEALEAMNGLQRFMEAQPEVGGSISLADVIPPMNTSLREGNPRYMEIGSSDAINGSLVAMLDSVSEPGDLSRFADEQYANGAVTLMFRDRQGETIRTAVARVKEYIDSHPLSTGQWQLAGGQIGVMAAVNEIILASQIEAVALALMVLAIICTVVYRASIAGMVFMVPVIISNMVTYAYMTWQDIGMSINTVPVAALGIGLGVDYAFYIADRIKEEVALGKSPEEAVRISLHTAGMGVIVTASVLIVATLLWWVSSLRFQAEMGLLMAIWLSVSAFSSLFVMPALLYVFRPRFIFGDGQPAPAAEKPNPSFQMI